MDRRQFNLTAVSLLSTLEAAHAATKQAFELGKDYQALRNALPSMEPGKVEVIEFFEYGSPHCRRIEPQLAAWRKSAPKNVHFTVVHTSKMARDAALHQRVFYALKSMGKEEQLRFPILELFGEGRGFGSVDEAVAALKPLGVDERTFRRAIDVYAQSSALALAEGLISAYNIDEVPSFGVAGKYVAGMNQNISGLLTYLVSR